MHMHESDIFKKTRRSVDAVSIAPVLSWVGGELKSKVFLQEVVYMLDWSPANGSKKKQMFTHTFTPVENFESSMKLT